ncbi:maleylpyruvate isomerase family mycothiol-dependent enzyme [Mycobacterium kyorinense]|uniref:Mycothiol-dependent maleylpyruvate isomerase metal-binding domain-containing protein n=1 Tax=Mycobacterium kyorinense TaxID=487514 RepID=A0A1X1Y9T7_9MYCO|nr:maleylpyruvate isomerase family mycothiol-dependent enzyme [Mycobacterium kyorinense]ORW07784.1 hypothetical protein AWC14_24070 [Mycobacterium kyorinense]
MDTDPKELHLAVCRRFGEAVRSADGKWDRPTPCEAWDARAVLEHVIGFHDVLLLRPLGLKPPRPRDNPQRRWELTYDALKEALDREWVIDVPLPHLTRDLLVHTWDLARAVDADDRLDPAWCTLFFDELPADSHELTASGMFAPPLAIDDDADIQSKLLARLGRNPSWRPPGASNVGL